MRSRGPLWDVTGDDPDQASFVADYEHLFRRQQQTDGTSSGGGDEKPFWSPFKVIVAVVFLVIIGIILKALVAVSIFLLGILPSWLVALIDVILGIGMLVAIIVGIILFLKKRP